MWKTAIGPITAATCAWTRVVGCDWDADWDQKKGPNMVPNGTVVHTIVMIRHGQYTPGSCDEERVLTSLGREQAALTGKRLKELLDAKKLSPVRTFVCSTMARASESGAIIAPYVQDDKTKVLWSELIREGACYRPVPPISEDKWPVTSEDFYKDGSRIEAGFRAFIERPYLPEGTPEQEVAKLKSYTTILCCHGNVIRYFLCRVLQISPECWLRMAVDNASYTIVDIHASGKVSLRSMGNNSHFPPHMMTYS